MRLVIPMLLWLGCSTPIGKSPVDSGTDTAEATETAVPGEECPGGGVYDCTGECWVTEAAAYIGDGTCDTGDRGPDFNCSETGFDGGDCETGDETAGGDATGEATAGGGNTGGGTSDTGTSDDTTTGGAAGSTDAATPGGDPTAAGSSTGDADATGGSGDATTGGASDDGGTSGDETDGSASAGGSIEGETDTPGGSGDATTGGATDVGGTSGGETDGSTSAGGTGSGGSAGGGSTGPEFSPRECVADGPFGAPAPGAYDCRDECVSLTHFTFFDIDPAGLWMDGNCDDAGPHPDTGIGMEKADFNCPEFVYDYGDCPRPF